MNSQIKEINEILNNLPYEALDEVTHYIQFMSERFLKKSVEKYMDLSWVGGLKEFKREYTSLELQKESLNWWNNKEIEK